MTHLHRPETPHEHDDSWGELLDLDADVFGSYLPEVLDRIEHHAGRPPGRVADIGAGTGTGSLAIALRFPDAEVVAIDSSAELLGRLHTSAEAQGLTGQVSTLLADLDDGWPDAGAFDLAWASSSLHHLADADRTLRELRAAVRSGGLLAVLETSSPPFFFPSDREGDHALEDRLHQLSTPHDMDPHPDWTENLRMAGFDLLEKLTVTTGNPSPAAGRYARHYFARARASLAERLGDDDKAAIDRLLHHDSAFHPDRLEPRSSRTVWIARRPATGIRPTPSKESPHEY